MRQQAESLGCVLSASIQPHVPNGYKINKPRDVGTVKLMNFCNRLHLNDAEIIRFPLSDDPRFVIELLEKSEDVAPLSAVIFDHLMKNPYLIPDRWKKGVTHFLGTIFSDSPGTLYVPYTYWDGEKWHGGYCPLGWGPGRPIFIALHLYLE